jgi:capsular exopolysaccharide synthesis family protein
VKEISPYFLHPSRRIQPEIAHDPLRFTDLGEAEGIDFESYLRTLRRHLWLIITIAGCAVILGAFHVIISTPMYTAQATILIIAPEPNFMNVTGASAEQPETVAAPDYFKTECDILKSRSLAARVIMDEGLSRKRGVKSASGSSGAIAAILISAGNLGGHVFGSGDSAKTVQAAPDPEDLRRHLVDEYLGALTIKPLNDTSLVGIRFSSPDPELAADIANAHAQAFISQGLELHRHAKEDVANFLQQKLIDLKQRLQDSEFALNNYRRVHGIIPGLTSLNGKDAIVLDRLSELSRDLTAVQVQRIGLQAQIDLIRDKQYNSLPAVVAHPMIQNLERELDDLYAQNADLSSKFKPDYPKVTELQARIRGVRERLNTEITREVSSIEFAYKGIQEKESRLEDEMSKQRALTMSLNDAGVQYAILQREVDANRELYESVLKAMKDARVEAEAQTSNVSIIDSAESPEAPSSPRVKRTLAVSLVLGLLAGLGTALLIDYLRNTLENPEDVTRLFRLPALAVIPKLPRRRIPSEINNPMMIYSRRTSGARRRTLNKSEAYYYFSIGEAYRNLRISLLASHDGVPHTVTLVTSALPSEGKTSTAVNSAVVLALSGRRVLLVDADLRKPRCHRHLAAINRDGLASVLSGLMPLDAALQPTQIENLDFLGSGDIPNNPSELLGSPEMTRTLEDLRRNYDHIIIDSPPVMVVSDALILSELADGVALVVDCGATSKQKVRAACTRLHHSRARLLGIVLNKAISDCEYYQHYYSEEVADGFPAPGRSTDDGEAHANGSA